MGTSPWVGRDPVARGSSELKLFRRHTPGEAGDWNHDDDFFEVSLARGFFWFCKPNSII